ncbi:MAG TPA: YtxH domain-containing protein [Chryseolinea sp.]|nr:YtxH domain-containing protein [Chryseolinea sp.]HPM31012.1 YtxH domain-containing protein [Chryseolinea sp.]
MNNTTKIVLGMAAAAAAGAAIGMLLAPEKGTDLQKKIKEGAEEWLKDFNGLISTGKEVMNRAKSSTEDEIYNMRKGLAELKD